MLSIPGLLDCDIVWSWRRYWNPGAAMTHKGSDGSRSTLTARTWIVKHFLSRSWKPLIHSEGTEKIPPKLKSSSRILERRPFSHFPLLICRGPEKGISSKFLCSYFTHVRKICGAPKSAVFVSNSLTIPLSLVKTVLCLTILLPGCR
jgi:hypothetical protein